MKDVINSKFGELKPSTHRTYWSGEWQLNNQPITVVTEFDNGVPDNMPTQFENFFADIPNYDLQFRQAASRDLLKLYNESWIDEEHQPISADEFARKIKLDGVSFREGEDTVEIYYDDGDLFAGHQIKVVANYEGAVKSAGLP